MKVLTTFTKQFCCMTMFPVWTPSIGMLDQCKYWEENSFCLPCSSLYLGLVSAHFTFHSMMFEWGKIWRKGWSKIIAETKPKKYGLYKKEAGVGSSPSIASLSNIDIYTIWGMMGKPISRGGIIWRRPKQHIRYYGVFLLILIILFLFPRYQLLN